MGKNKWLFAAACVIGLSVMAAPGQSSAAEQSVAVSLPKFEVKLNGNQVENDYRQYPLLVYKDITYVPMTWYDSRLLGLETGWSAQDGLSIAKGSVTSSYAAYAADHKNAGSARATISSFGITINGKTVDNAKEPYPLLTFRDVTYFPLTWKFAHEEFGWDYVWDPSAGLAITADNPKVEKVSLPAAAGGNNVALFKGYYYFTETEGTTVQVYRAPEQDTSSKQRVYSYNGESVYGFNNYLQFWTANDELWFSYHVGGATMGSDVYCKVGDDGKATLEHRGYLDFKPTTNGTLIIRQSVPPGGNNLSLAPAGQEDRNGGSVGKPDLIYGWHITDNGGGRGFAGDRSTTVIGDEVYVMGSSYPVENGASLNRIYKINLNTNETTEVTSFGVKHFKIINEKLYYVKEEDGLLYASKPDGSGGRPVSDRQAANWYDEVGGSIYYTEADAAGGYRLYKADPAGADTLVVKDTLESVQTVNDRIVCKLAAGGDYGIKVLDVSGALKVAVADQAAHLFAYDDAIVFVSAEDQSVKRLK